jgi:hypothetical protein
MPETLHIFSQADPFTPAKLHANLEKLTAAVNALSRISVLQVPPGNVGQAMRTRGGAFGGPVTAPAIGVGADGGPVLLPVTTADLATVDVAGVVRSSANVQDAEYLTDEQAQMSELVLRFNQLVASLRHSGAMV